MGLRRTALKFVLICYAIHWGTAESVDVVWAPPAEGIIHQPGDNIIGEWTSGMPLVSPSFRLCRVLREPALGGRAGDERESSQCGPVPWLQVQELKDGYSVVITAPETLREGKYRLVIQDNFGNDFMSPIFGLGPASGGENPAGTLTTKALRSSGNALEIAEHPPGSTLSGGSGLVAPVTAGMTSPRIAVLFSPSTSPAAPVSRRPVPTAAFAIPLSAVSGIFIVASLLFLNNRRKLVKRKEFKTLILSKRVGDSEEYGEVQRTLSVLSDKGMSEYYDVSEPLPVLFPRPEPRVATRNPFTPMDSYSSSSTIFDDGLGYHHEEPIVTRGKSLTDQYTAAGTKLLSEDHIQAVPAIPSGLLPTRMSPVHIRLFSSETIHSLPLPPTQSAVSMIEPNVAFPTSTADLKGS